MQRGAKTSLCLAVVQVFLMEGIHAARNIQFLDFQEQFGEKFGAVVEPQEHGGFIDHFILNQWIFVLKAAVLKVIVQQGRVLLEQIAEVTTQFGRISFFEADIREADEGERNGHYRKRLLVYYICKVEKKDYILYWKATAADDWKRVNLLFKNRDYIFALFCAHLTLEKLIKAHWVKDNVGNFPPKIHNLNKLAAQTKLSLTDEELIFCADMNKFQIEGRYPDYVSDIYKIVNSKYTANYLKQCQKLRRKLAGLLR
jgi:HEPN domain-containing protein